jgi:hypothetical protein
MTTLAISGASAALATLQTQASLPAATGDVGTMDLETANTILADYVTNRNQLDHYTQAQTDAATESIDNQIAASIQQAGGDVLAGYVAFLHGVAAALQNTTFYGLSVNGTTLTFGQDLAVNQALSAARARETTLLQSGAIAYNTVGQLVGKTADGATVLGILDLFGSSDPSDLLDGVTQWNAYAGNLSVQDTVSLSPTAQAAVASSSSGAPGLGSPDALILQLSASLTSGSSDLVDGAIQALAGIVLDNSLSWSMADQVTAQTALGYVQASEPFLDLSATDTQLIAQATSASVLDMRAIGANGLPSVLQYRFEFGDTGGMETGAVNYNLTGDQTLAVFLSLSPADQALWFQTNVQGYASIEDYVTNLQANDQMNAIIQEAVANGTMTNKYEPYAQIKDPIVAAAQKLLQTTQDNTSPAFTAQAIQIVTELETAPASSTVALPPGALSFLQTASTPMTAAQQALQALQSGSYISAADQAALQTLQNVLQSIKDQKTASAGATKAGATKPGGSAPATPITVAFSLAKAGSGGTGLAIASETIAIGSVVNATV